MVAVGSFSDGLIIAVLPHAIANGNIQTEHACKCWSRESSVFSVGKVNTRAHANPHSIIRGIMAGKLNGQIPAVTPNGALIV